MSATAGISQVLCVKADGGSFFIGLCCRSDGCYMVINGKTNKIHIYDGGGRLLQSNYGNRLFNRRLYTPTLITELPDSRVAVFDSYTKKIQKLSFTEDLIETFHIGMETYSLSTNQYGHMIMVHQINKHCRQISIRNSENGYVIRTVSIAKTLQSVTESPIYAVYSNSNNNLIALDPIACTLSVLTLDGAEVMRVGKQGYRTGEMENPRSLCLDKWNQVIVADTKNDRVVRYQCNRSNHSKTLVQNIYKPLAVALDSCGHLVVMTATNMMVFDYREGVTPTAPPLL